MEAVSFAAEPLPIPEPKPERARVLIVDDNVDAANSLAYLLAMMGYSCIPTYTGASALRIAQTERPPVVLLDLGLPDMRGEEVARRLRSEPWGQSIQIIAISGWDRPHDRARTRAAGINEHLAKPVDTVQLLDLITATDLN